MPPSGLKARERALRPRGLVESGDQVAAMHPGLHLLTRPHFLATSLVVAIAYFLAARFGLAFGFVEQSVTLLWPPTGIALAAIVLGGYQMVPAIVLGAVAVNASTGSPPLFVLATAIGNPLEAIAGAAMLRRFVAFDARLGRVADVMGLLFLAALASTTISATLGVSGLCASGGAPWADFGTIWVGWWIGDGMGNMIVAPAILTWAARPRDRLDPAGSATALAITVLVGYVVFVSTWLDAVTVSPLSYWPFPLIVWAALRQGPRGAATLTLAVSVMAFVGAVQGVGPFVSETQLSTLLHLLAYLFVLAMTSMTLAAVVAERRRISEADNEKAHGLKLLRTVAQATNDAASVDGAWQQILALVCRYTGWPVAHVYRSGAEPGVLEPSNQWYLEDPERYRTFREVTERTTFAEGVGLPGRVLAAKGPAWIVDVTADDNFLRARLAHDLGVRGAFAFPVLVGPEVVSVMEFYSPEAKEPDQRLLELMAQIGTQIGRVIEREQLREALAKVLSGFVPICAQCKAIRNAQDLWVPVERYVQERTAAIFSHGICDNCARELYQREPPS